MACLPAGITLPLPSMQLRGEETIHVCPLIQSTETGRTEGLGDSTLEGTITIQ